MGWAYPAAPSERAVAAVPGGTIYTIPGSRLRLSEAQIDDPWAAVDWLPNGHPPAPAILLSGRKPDVYACGLCHMVDGQGGRGVPSLAGLSRNYIITQLAAFASGQRRSSYFLRDALNMATVARAARAPEIAAAADYYWRLSYLPWIRVIETAQVPATAPSYWGWTDVLPGSRREAIGRRIVEVAEDNQRARLSDPHSGFVAYAPLGAIARGRALVAAGVASQPPCVTCHGVEMKGTNIAPPLAGRSPTYLARQLWDMHSGARHNPTAAPMQPIAKALDAAKIIDIVAYLASLHP
jgi:cytochrome c553